MIENIPEGLKNNIKFVKNIKSFIKFIHDLNLQDKLNYTNSNSEESSDIQNHELYKKNIVFTDADLPK